MSNRNAQAAVWLVGLLPALTLVARFVCGDGLGAEPIETVTHVTGEWGLRLLLLTLAVTPVRRMLGWRGVAPFRRTLGLLAFGYASLHLATWIALEHFFAWSAIVEDVVERPYVTVGFAPLLSCLEDHESGQFVSPLSHQRGRAYQESRPFTHRTVSPGSKCPSSAGDGVLDARAGAVFEEVGVVHRTGREDRDPLKCSPAPSRRPGPRRAPS